MNKICLLSIFLFSFSVKGFSAEEYGIQDISNGVRFSVTREVIESTPSEDENLKKACDSKLTKYEIKKKVNTLLTKLLLQLTGGRNTSKDFLTKTLGDFKISSEKIYMYQDRDPTIPSFKIHEAVWKFDGVVLNIGNVYPIKAGMNKPYWVDKISITKSKIPLHLPVNIGSPVEDVQCFFGRFYASEIAEKLLEYDTDGEYGDQIAVKIYFDSSLQVKQMDFEYYED